MVLPNNAPLLNSGVMSLKTIPGLGKSATSRIMLRMRAMSSLIFNTSQFCHFHSRNPRPARLTPDLARGLDDPFELALLVVFADQITHYVGRKAALGADGNLLQGHESSRLIDASFKVIDRFQLRDLGAHQSEYDDLSFRQKSQRLKAARSRAVIFEQEAIIIELVQQP